ncbi:hypothetical protein ACVXG8_02955 [Escherichia coli]
MQFSDPEFHKKKTTMMGSRNATPEDFAKVGRLMAERENHCRHDVNPSLSVRHAGRTPARCD